MWFSLIVPVAMNISPGTQIRLSFLVGVNREDRGEIKEGIKLTQQLGLNRVMTTG